MQRGATGGLELPDRRRYLRHRLRARYVQHVREAFFDQRFSCAQTTRHDHPAIVVKRLLDGIQGFFNRRIDETTGIHHHQVGTFEVGHSFVTIFRQLAQNSFGIDQGFWAA